MGTKQVKFDTAWKVSLFTAIMLLIFLGVRVPDLAHQRLGQNRPRAVIAQESIEVKGAACCLGAVAAILPPIYAIPLPEKLHATAKPTEPLFPGSTPVRSYRPSRASPPIAA